MIMLSFSNSCLHHRALLPSSPFSTFNPIIQHSLRPIPRKFSPNLPTYKRFNVQSIDAAQSYDYESHLSSQCNNSPTLKIALIGFGNFGQFLAKTLIQQGHIVLAYSRSNYTEKAQKLNVAFYQDPNDLCEEHPEVVLMSTSIISTEPVLRSFPFQRLRRSTLFVDVLSVKEFPKNLFMKLLPEEFDILCTHPMFGPESGKESWSGLPFVYDRVRIGNEEERMKRCERFLAVFEREGCRMVEMTCAEHDRFAGWSQFITHTMGRVLEKLGLETTPINTKGYETLLNLVENTSGDSFDLYYGLFMYNKNALEQLERLDMAFQSLKRELFENLHGVYRKQLFGDDVGVRPVNGRLIQDGASKILPESLSG